MAETVYPEEFLKYWERLKKRQDRWNKNSSLSQSEEYEKWLSKKKLDYSIGQPEASGNQKIEDWFNNAITGDRDFNRQLALQQMQQDFNSAEAALAHKRQVNIAQNSTLWQAEQLKQIGINPAWAIAGGGGATPAITTAPTATSQAGNATPSGQQATQALTTFVQLVVTAARLAILKK